MCGIIVLGRIQCTTSVFAEANHQPARGLRVFQLDIDSPLVEDGSIQYILSQQQERGYPPIHELAWEHHVFSNIIMRKIWSMGNVPKPTNLTLRQSYDFFLRLRQVRIRAHSWV